MTDLGKPLDLPALVLLTVWLLYMLTTYAHHNTPRGRKRWRKPKAPILCRLGIHRYVDHGDLHVPDPRTHILCYTYQAFGCRRLWCLATYLKGPPQLCTQHTRSPGYKTNLLNPRHREDWTL